MTQRLHRIIQTVEPWDEAAPPLPELPDEETWSAPDRLSDDDCFDHLGADWRVSAAPFDPEDDQ